MRRTITTLALTGLVLAAAGGTALAADPIGPTGTGPIVTTAGTYRVVDAANTAGPWLVANPADDHTFTIRPGDRVEVVDAGSWCIDPDTREQRNADTDHHAVCDAPGVPAAWARPALP